MPPTTIQILPVNPDARFVIAPFEHRGAHFDPRPLVAVRFDAFDAVFEVKPCREWLFFRARERPEAVFALPSAPVGLDAPEDLARWLEVALESGQFHRFVAMNEANPYLDGPFLFFFGADGRGFVREPWDDDGPGFEWSRDALSAPTFLEWPRQPLVERAMQLLGDPKNKLSKTLYSRDIRDEQRQNAPLEWLCGSHDELALLTRALLHSQDAFWDEASRAVALYTSESQYGRATLFAVFRFFFDGQSETRVDGRLRVLSDLFLDFHTPIGHKWEFQDAMGGRASWEPEGQEIVVNVSAPTAHERLEAGFFLREWLRDKLPAAEIGALLG